MTDRRQRAVYLLHFSKPFGTAKQQARHYIGMTFGGAPEVEARLEAHRAGQGAAITRHAVKVAGVELVLARTWENVPFGFEASLKNSGGAKRICPVCMDGHVTDTSRRVVNVRRRARESGYHIGFRSEP